MFSVPAPKTHVPSLQANQNRREFKFLMPSAEADGFREFIAAHIPVDRVAAQGYPVVSEYYDTPDRHSYWQKIWGARNRRRLRARVYGRTDGSIPPAAFIEIKHKHYVVGVKRRVAVGINELPLLASGIIPPSLLDPGRTNVDQQVLAEIKDLMLNDGLRPILQLRYDRMAYDSGRDGTIRVTFDSRLRCRFQLKPLVADDPDFPLPVLLNDADVVEIKTIGPVPVWLREAAGRFHLTACSMSKYCRALERYDPVVERHPASRDAGPPGLTHLQIT